MTTGQTVIRVVLGAVGAALLLGGLLVGLADTALWIVAAWMIFNGSILVIVVVIEVSRYRSQSAEHGHLPVGRGGGETQPLEPRFKRSDEVFVDHTTNQTMRVYPDADTGERRYLAQD